jgi:2-oxoisovalerate dehydrogenase E2 component (dihydrolipoyl transacylase)
MNILRRGGSIPRILHTCQPQSVLRIRSPITSVLSRGFHAGPALWGIKSQILKDVGEGKQMLCSAVTQVNWSLISE